MELTPIDWELVKRRLFEGCNPSEISRELGFATSFPLRRCEKELGIPYKDFIHQHASKGNNYLRSAQMKKALSGDTQMMIFLGKNRLNQSDKCEQKIEADNQILHFLAALKQVDQTAFESTKKDSDYSEYDIDDV
jgi:hypothetical protein